MLYSAVSCSRGQLEHVPPASTTAAPHSDDSERRTFSGQVWRRFFVQFGIVHLLGDSPYDPPPAST